MTRPRRSACFAACRSSSGESPSRAQSLSVRFTDVIGTGPLHARFRLRHLGVVEHDALGHAEASPLPRARERQMDLRGEDV